MRVVRACRVCRALGVLARSLACFRAWKEMCTNPQLRTTACGNWEHLEQANVRWLVFSLRVGNKCRSDLGGILLQ